MFVKLDDRDAFRRWAGTARAAAAEAGDPAVMSWVLGQEAYGHYYGGDLRAAVDVARQAQDLPAGHRTWAPRSKHARTRRRATHRRPAGRWAGPRRSCPP